MEEIVESISKNDEDAKKFLKMVKSIMIFTADAFIKSHSIPVDVQVIQRMADAFKSKGSAEDDFNPIRALKKVKTDFEKLVDRCCPGEDAKLLVFIDDLDRLEPVRAIELLECLKLFMECKKCVFILAIDFDVVLQGVTQKYNWIDDGSDNISKAKSYFDKFIQLPFYVPINFYKTDKFISKRLQSILEIESDEKLLLKYKDATRNSVGNNPRSINRLLNNYSLALETFRLKAGGQGLSNQEYLVLYILLCIQISYDSYYESLISEFIQKGEPSFKSFLNNFSYSDWSGGLQLEVLVSSLNDLLKSEENDEGLSYGELERLIDFTGVTSIRDNSVTEKLNPASARYDIIFDSEKRYKKLRDETTAEDKIMLLKKFEEKLGENDKLGENRFRIGAQKTQYWTIYVHGAKFAEVTYQGRIGINFGRGTLSDRVKNEFFTDEWADLVKYLRKESGLDEVKNGERIARNASMSFSIRDNSNPIRLIGISTEEEIEEAVKILDRAYEIFYKYNFGAEEKADNDNS